MRAAILINFKIRGESKVQLRADSSTPSTTSTSTTQREPQQRGVRPDHGRGEHEVDADGCPAAVLIASTAVTAYGALPTGS
jgi:hypothetical protein